MQIYHRSKNTPPPTALAIGNFDGLHLGHRAILAATHATGLTPAVLTFEPHPSLVLRPQNPALRIYGFAEKCRLLRGCGIEALFLARFHSGYAALTPQQFIAQELRHRCNAQHIFVGEDFAFGQKRGGSIAMLQEAGFAVTIVPPVLVEGTRCSSTRIREALAKGDISTANQLLGTPYTISGRVTPGQQKGRTIGFPTLNIPFRSLMATPAYGVYQVELSDGQRGIANFGIRPTVNTDKNPSPQLEVHLLKPGRIPAYGERVRIHILRFIRAEMRFPSLEALQKQIAQDIEGLC